MRRRWYIVSAVLAAGAFVPVTGLESHDVSWCDAVTGSIKREHVSMFGRSGGEIVDVSPLETHLKQAGIPWTPKWQFLHDHIGGWLGGRGWECGTAPPIYHLRSGLDAFVQISNEQQVRDFITTLQSGTKEEQEATINAAMDAVMKHWQSS